MRTLAILGSTGSIGRSALAVVDAHPARLRVAALAAGDNAELLAGAGGAVPPGGGRAGLGRAPRIGFAAPARTPAS